MNVFDAPDLFVRDYAKSGSPLAAVASASTFWTVSGHGTVSRFYSGLRLAYAPSTADGRPVLDRMEGDPRVHADAGLAWFFARQNGTWEPFSLSGPLNVTINRRVKDEPGWTPARGCYWLCGPGLGNNLRMGDCVESFVDWTLIHADEAETFEDVPLTFHGIRDWLARHTRVYGLLWTHRDGRMARVLRDDILPGEKAGR